LRLGLKDKRFSKQLRLPEQHSAVCLENSASLCTVPYKTFLVIKQLLNYLTSDLIFARLPLLFYVLIAFDNRPAMGGFPGGLHCSRRSGLVQKEKFVTG